MSQLPNLISKLNSKIGMGSYQFLFEQYPEIEINQLIQFINELFEVRAG